MGELRCLSPAVPVAAPRTLSVGFDFPCTCTERGFSRRIKFASPVSLEIQGETSRNCFARRRRSCTITSTAFWGLPVPADFKLGERHSTLKCRSRALSKRQASPGTVVMSFSDPELHSVLQLASDTELLDLSDILYGRSFLSPLLKSLTPGDGSRDDHYHDGQPPRTLAERDALRIRLEARFLFLAADAKATLSGRRPSYRDALLQVRKKLRIPCSASLSTEDIESEIFLHLLQQYSRKPSETPQTSPAAISKSPSPSPAADSGSKIKKKKRWRVGGLPNVATLRGKELLSAVVKGGSAVTVSTLQRMAVRKLSGKVLLETARYQLAKEAVFKTGGQMAALLESRVAMLAAKQGLVGAAKRYVTMRSAMTILGPMLWGTLLADMLISAVGTDYARVVRAIYAFAQIRLLRSDSWGSASQYCG